MRARLPRHAHLQGAWRPRLLGSGPIARPRHDRFAQRRRRHHRHGAEFARPGRIDREIWNARAEGALPAAPCPRRRDSLLCLDRAVLGLGRRRHARRRHRRARQARGTRHARHQAHLGQALHYARAQRHAARPCLPPVRSREPSRPWRGYRHHARADPDQPPRRRDRTAASSRRHRFPQRADARSRRVRADRLDHRRRGAGGPGLAHADELPRRGALDLASRDERRRRQGPAPHQHGLCPHQKAVQSADRLHGGRRGAARAHDRDGLRARGRPRCHRRDGLRRRKARRDLGAAQIRFDRAHAPEHQRCARHPWRQGHLRRTEQLPSGRLSDDAGDDHGGRRQHPHPHVDHLRARRAAQSPLSLHRDRGAAR